MGEEFKHLVLVKFKEGVHVGPVLLAGMDKFREMDSVQSVEWGRDVEGPETLRRGFTHALIMTFRKKEDTSAFVSHPNRHDVISVISTVIEEMTVLDFYPFVVKTQGTLSPSEEVIERMQNSVKNKLQADDFLCSCLISC